MREWTPIWGKILDSSLNEQPLHLRWVFVSLLILKDREHVVRMGRTTLARRLNIERDKLDEALKILSSPDGLTEHVQPHEGRRIEPIEGHDGWKILNGPSYAEMVMTEKTREYKRKWMQNHRNLGSTDGSAVEPPPTPDSNGSLEAFEQFWKAYPRKIKRGDAEYAFVEVGAIKHMNEIMAALKWQSESDDWTNENGKFIPSPSTYLRDKRWTDEEAWTEPPSLKDVPEEQHTQPYDGDVLFHIGKRTWARDSAGPQPEDFPGREDLYGAYRVTWESWIKIPARVKS